MLQAVYGALVNLGGPAPSSGPLSPHLASRLEVERVLLDGVPGSVALRASIAIGAQSRAFRFLVRLIESRTWLNGNFARSTVRRRPGKTVRLPGMKLKRGFASSNWSRVCPKDGKETFLR